LILPTFEVSWQLAVGSWQLAVGSWQLAVVSWQLAVGSWQLLVGRWQLAVGCWLLLVPTTNNISLHRQQSSVMTIHSLIIYFKSKH
jgi:hypothetical protein